MSNESIIATLIAEAARAGADAIEVEYKDGYEQVCAMRGPLGFGIAHFRSSSAEGTALRRELYAMGKRWKAIAIGAAEYEVRVQKYDSFGEDAFHIEFREGPEAATRASPRGRSSKAGQRSRSQGT